MGGGALGGGGGGLLSVPGGASDGVGDAAGAGPVVVVGAAAGVLPLTLFRALAFTMSPLSNFTAPRPMSLPNWANTSPESCTCE